MVRILKPDIVTFSGRGKDKLPRKKNKLLAYVNQGAVLGSMGGAAAGTTSVLVRLPQALAGRAAANLTPFQKIVGIGLATGISASNHAKTAAGFGGLIGAGAYGVNRFLNRKKKNQVVAPLTKRQRLTNAYNNLTSKTRNNG